jgi:hypothetical protein
MICLRLAEDQAALSPLTDFEKTGRAGDTGKYFLFDSLLAVLQSVLNAQGPFTVAGSLRLHILHHPALP